MGNGGGSVKAKSEITVELAAEWDKMKRMFDKYYNREVKEGEGKDNDK